MKSIEDRLLGLTFSDLELTALEEDPGPEKIKAFEVSEVGRWLIQLMLAMQRDAASKIMAGRKLLANDEVVDLTAAEVNIERGKYAALENILKAVELLKETPGGSDV